MMSKGSFVLTDADFENAKLLLDEEVIKQLSATSMFQAGIYCILAQAERYDKQIKIYKRLLREGLDSPKNIFDNASKFHRIIKKSRYPNEKEKRIRNFAEWWIGATIPQVIIKDVGNGRKHGIKLRNALAENAPAVGFKTASLLMIKCGYEDVAPIDIWMLRFLRGRGFNVQVPDYMTVGGMTKTTYISLEDILRNIAKEHNVSLATFQATVWGKYSKWNVRKERRLF